MSLFNKPIRSTATPIQRPPQPANDIRVGVSITRKLNLGNYESAEVWVSLSGIAPGTTAAEIQAALATGALAYDAIKVALSDKIRDQRQKSMPSMPSLPAGGK